MPFFGLPMGLVSALDTTSLTEKHSCFAHNASLKWSPKNKKGPYALKRVLLKKTILK